MENKRNNLPSLHSAFVFFLILSWLDCQTEVFSQSLLWRISGNGTPSPSYLYGTIHIRDKQVFQWQDSIYARLGLCQAFAGELDLNADNIMKAVNYMMLPDGQTLRDRFSEEDYQMIKDAVRSCSGYDLALLDRFKPATLVSLCFIGNESENLEGSVDELLYKKAVESGKQVSGIETVEEQAALLDKIPDSYVLEYFRNLDDQKDELRKLIRCYCRADLDSLWILMQDEESGSMLNDELIRTRNIRMTERVIPLIRQKSTFIAVGSGHLPGMEGIIALLRKEGFAVEPERIVW
jgi:uncharacterized protein YbaP (TraB family)